MRNSARFILLTVATLAAGVAALGNASAQVRTEYERHLDAATRNAVGDAFLLQNHRKYFCINSEGTQADINEIRARNNIRVPLTRIADDAWFIGSEYVGQYILKSSSGFMLVDTLNNANEAVQFTVPALQSLGLSAALPLLAIDLTHGHFDHDGGAAYLRDNYGPKIYLGSGDAQGKAYAPTAIDSTDFNPRVVEMAGRSVTVMPAPGHSPGTTTSIIPIYDSGKQVLMMVSGGSGMPNSISDSRKYLDSVERSYRLAKAMNVQGGMHPHAFYDGSLASIKSINATGLPKPSPFVVGNAKFLQGLAIWRECSAAFNSKIDATAANQEWRVSVLNFEPASPSQTRMAARLFNGWGPMADEEVIFSADGRGTSCTARTDANGIATCPMRWEAFQSPNDTVTASYAGAANADRIDLPSSSVSGANNGCRDLNAIKNAMGSRRGSMKYQEALDIDRSGVIDVRDVATVSRLVVPGTVCN